MQGKNVFFAQKNNFMIQKKSTGCDGYSGSMRKKGGGNSSGHFPELIFTDGYCCDIFPIPG
jgi:hypothetical protein